MLVLDDARKEFSEFLAENPEARWRLDAALAHVVAWAYSKGYNEGIGEKEKVNGKRDITAQCF